MSSLKDARIRTTIPPLTPRQREVLGLLARGYSNPQIGEALGISLDGAKWHVAEIMARLGVDSREEAAGYWRDYNRPAARLARLARAFVPVAAWAKWGAAVAGVGAASAIAVVTVVAMNGGGNAHTPAASVASGTATASATSTFLSAASSTVVVSTVVGTPTASSAVPTPSSTPPPGRTGIRTVDKAIAAMEAQDFDALASQLVTQEIACPPYQQTAGPPASCEEASQGRGGETRPAYTYSECHGPQHYPVETAVLSLADQAGAESLYAVAKNPDGTYRLVFQDESPNAFTLTVNGQGITTVGRACGASAATVLNAAGTDSVVYLAPGTPEPPSSSGLTGIQPVDRAIAAMQAQDFAALASQLVTHQESCGLNPPPADSWLSPCAPGVATGTVQHVYLVAGCDSPTWMPASTAVVDIAAMLSGSNRLYGVRENADATYSVVFADDNESAFTLTVADAGVTTLGRSCGVPASAVLPAGGTVIAGPFE
jgi:DNA-binding CsgD family transcriptional regulator